MAGLVALLIGGVYLLLSVIVIHVAMRWAVRTNKDPRMWGVVVASLLLFVPLWEVLPTIVANRYYCATKAGFYLYENLEQRQNEATDFVIGGERGGPQSAMPNFGPRKHSPSKRFSTITESSRPVPFISTTVTESKIIDTKTGQVLAKVVGVGYGYGNPMLGGKWRLVDWLPLERCSPGRRDFVKFENALKNID